MSTTAPDRSPAASSTDALSPARAVALVAGRELRTQLRSRSFLIGLLVTIAIFGVYALVFQFISTTVSSSSLGVTAQARPLVPALQQAAAAQGLTLEIREVDRAEGERLVAADDLDALLAGAPGSYELVTRDSVGTEVQALVSGVVSQQTLTTAMQSAGLDPAAVAARAQVAVTTLEPVDPQAGERLGIALVASVLLFMSLVGYGTLVAQGVVEEKSSRVVELLLSTIRPSHLLTGKVLGLGAVGLVQLVILGAIGLVATTAAGILTAPTAAAGALASAVLWYLLGYFLYASVYAAVGSTVSRQEELQNLLTPIMFPLLLPFIFAVSVLPGDPRNTFGTVLSFIPFFAPSVMPARVALGVAPWWQVLISALLTLATTVGVVALAARVYRNSVLRTGGRVSFREALTTR